MIRRAIRWLDRLDWVDVFMYTFGSGVLTFFGGLVITGIHEGFHGNIEGRFLLVAWARVFVVALIGWLFFTKVWPRLAEWARERESNGHRQSSAGDRSETGTIPVTGYSATGTITAESAGIDPSPEPVAQEIIAWRGWGLGQDDRGPVLWSLVMRCKWDGPTLVADKKPTNGNEHGIYALAEMRSDISRQQVVGTVALSGTVVEGERGFRAERATIRSLRLRMLPANAPTHSPFMNAPFMPLTTYGGEPLTWRGLSWDIAAQLAERYQCDCEVDWLPTSSLPAEELTA